MQEIDGSIRVVMTAVICVIQIAVWVFRPRWRAAVAFTLVLSAMQSAWSLMSASPNPDPSFLLSQWVWVSVGAAAAVWLCVWFWRSETVRFFQDQAVFWPSAWRCGYEYFRAFMFLYADVVVERRFAGRIVGVERLPDTHATSCRGDMCVCVDYVVDADVTVTITDHKRTRVLRPSRGRRIQVRAGASSLTGSDTCEMSAMELDMLVAGRGSLSGVISDHLRSDAHDAFELHSDYLPEGQTLTWGTKLSLLNN